MCGFDLRIRSWLSAAGVSLVLASNGGAWPGPNVGGMLVVHDAGVTYTEDGGAPWPSEPPASCETVDNELATGIPPGGVGRVWKVYAAFPQTSSPRLKALCFGAAFPPSVTVLAGGLPDDMDFEVPMAGWPELSGYGTMMSFLQVKTSRIAECYWLAGYGDSGQWQLIGHPLQVTEFVDDSAPPVVDQIMALGSIGFGEPGHTYCPDGDPLGACCLSDGSCQIVSRSDCALLNGIFRGEPWGCDPDPCHIGACCFRELACFVITEAECNLAYSMYFGDLVPCDPFPCGPWTVCCWHGFCYLRSPWDCELSGGTVHPEFLGCEPNPCTGLGACCLIDGTCLNYDEPGCDELGGIFYLDVHCNANPCGPDGACCLPGSGCIFTSRDACVLWEGDWQGSGIPCSPDPCLADGACCFPDGTCEVLDSEECAVQQGNWMGAETTCVPNPCVPTPVERVSWGRVKQRYR